MKLLFKANGPTPPAPPSAPRVTCPNCKHEFDHPGSGTAAPAAPPMTHEQLHESRKQATLAFARKHGIIKSTIRRVHGG